MARKESLLLLWPMVFISGIFGAGPNLTDFVNLFIGTDGGGWGISEVPPGPQVPFGALRLSPDTSLGLEPYRVHFEENGGYYYPDPYLECFSHTHVDGAGNSDWKNFGVTVTRALDATVISNAGYRTKYRHETERLQVGYYGVQLDTWNTFAEVTACGTHAGVHRYTCFSDANTSGPCNLVIDLCHADVRTDHQLDFAYACKNAEIISVTKTGNSTTVIATMFNAGQMTSASKFGGVRVFIAMTIDVVDTTGAEQVVNVSYWRNRTVFSEAPENGTYTSSRSLGVAITASSSAAVIFHVRSALSFVSAASALNNLEVTLLRADGSWKSFDECRQSGVAQWEEVLRQIAIGDMERLAQTQMDRLVVFYTAMYHAHMSPTTYSEANGEFMGFDGKVHKLANASTTRHVSDLSLWDTYRSHAPLMILIQPDMARDTVTSMISMYTLSGNDTFPVWPMASVETGEMVGIHGVIMASDAIRKGVRGLDIPTTASAVFTSVKHQNTEHLTPYNFAPINWEHRSAAKTLDYAVDSGAALALSLFFNRSDLAASFAFHAQAYRQIWNPKTAAFCGRYINGSYNCDYMYLPYPWQGNFVEGNGEEYRWYVPHDPYGLISLFNSTADYVTALNDFFVDTAYWPFNTTFPNPFFWAGNEPTFFTPFQFNYAGNEYAHLTQKWVQAMDDAYFFNGHMGVPGNDDYGAMSSWLIFGYLGLYPAATSNNYTLHVPRFDNVTLSVSPRGAAATPFSTVGSNGGPVLQVTAHARPTSGPVYLANVTLNGVPLTAPFVTHDALLGAAASSGSSAKLDFFLTGTPVVFGAAAPSEGGPMPFTPAEPALNGRATLSPESVRHHIERRVGERRRSRRRQ